MPLKIILILAEVGGPPSSATGCLGRKEEKQQLKVFTFYWEALHIPVPSAELWALVCVRAMGGTMRSGGGHQGLETWLGKLQLFIFMPYSIQTHSTPCAALVKKVRPHGSCREASHTQKIKQDISHRRQSYNTALPELSFILNYEIVSTVCCDEQLHLPNLLLNLLNIKAQRTCLSFKLLVSLDEGDSVS